MKKLLILAAGLLFVLMSLQSAYAEHLSVSSDAKIGSIADISYYPEKPLISKPVIISFAVKNTGDARQSLKIKLFILKGGNIVHQADSILNVYPGQKKGNSSEFSPKEIGSYEILAKLYDGHETKLVDMMSIRMNVESEIGPFDLIVSPLARKVQKGEELPVLLTIINKGIAGTDVSVRVEVKCYPNPISDEFMLFATPDKQIDKIVTMPVCSEKGAHNIESSIRINDRIYAISSAQFYVNDTIFTMDMKIPSDIMLEQGGTKLLDISVRNTALYALHNIKLFLEGFPAEWVNIQPESVAELKRNETAIFLVRLNLPEDADARTYLAKFIASSDELSNREASVLKVMEAEVVPSVGRKIPVNYYPYAVAALFAAALFLIIKTRRKSRGGSLASLRPILMR